MKTNKPRGMAVGARCELMIILKRGLLGRNISRHPKLFICVVSVKPKATIKAIILVCLRSKDNSVELLFPHK